MQSHLFSVVSHHTFARGDTIRCFEWRDLFAEEQNKVGPSKCESLTVLAVRGKMIRQGGKKYHQMVRHPDVRKCPVGAIYLWCHYLYDCIGKDTSFWISYVVCRVFIYASLRTHIIWHCSCLHIHAFILVEC